MWRATRIITRYTYIRWYNCITKLYKNKSERKMNTKEKMRKEYPYRGVTDKNYIKDKKAFFKKNGNGWWWGKDKEKSQVEELINDKPSTGETNA